MNTHNRSTNAAQIQPSTHEDTAIFLLNFRQKIERENAIFQDIEPILRAKYKDQFVALSGGEIIDHDRNEMSLAKRVSNLPKDKFILIEYIM
jgi:hypothetical protein